MRSVAVGFWKGKCQEVFFFFFDTAYNYTNILYIFVWTKIASGMTRWAKLTTGSMAARFLEYILLKIILKFLLKSNYVE